MVPGLTHAEHPQKGVILTKILLYDLAMVWYGMVWGEEGEPAWSPDIVNLKTALRAAQPDPSCI